jgi:hypothetical protein
MAFGALSGPAHPERILERLETGGAVGLERHHLAVEYGLLHRQLGGGLGELRKPASPVMPIAANEARLAILHATEHAVAVELDLMKPPVARRRRLDPPHPLVPQEHRTAAVLALGDDPLEAAVLQRMIFDLHRQPLAGRVGIGAFGNRPALQDAVQLEAEVVMQLR